LRGLEELMATFPKGFIQVKANRIFYRPPIRYDLPQIMSEVTPDFHKDSILAFVAKLQCTSVTRREGYPKPVLHDHEMLSVLTSVKGREGLLGKPEVADARIWVNL